MSQGASCRVMPCGRGACIQSVSGLHSVGIELRLWAMYLDQRMLRSQWRGERAPGAKTCNRISMRTIRPNAGVIWG